MTFHDLDLDLLPNPLKAFYDQYGYQFSYGTYWVIEKSIDKDGTKLIKGYSIEKLVQRTINITNSWDTDELLNQLNNLQSHINRLDELINNPNYYSLVKDKLRLNDFQVFFLTEEVKRLSIIKRNKAIKLIPFKGLKEIEGQGLLRGSSNLFFPIEAAGVWNIPLDNPIILDEPISFQIIIQDNEYKVFPKWSPDKNLGYWEGQIVSNSIYFDNVVLEESNYERAINISQLLQVAYDKGWGDCKSKIQRSLYSI